MLRRKCYYHKRKHYTGVADIMILHKRDNIAKHLSSLKCNAKQDVILH